jgi:hypothetical protein
MTEIIAAMMMSSMAENPPSRCWEVFVLEVVLGIMLVQISFKCGSKTCDPNCPKSKSGAMKLFL